LAGFFFAAQRAFCATAIFFLAAGLMVRRTVWGACFASRAAAGLPRGVGRSFLLPRGLVPLSASSAAIALSMRPRWARRSARICAVSTLPLPGL
jgi:hypothetical protein